MCCRQLCTAQLHFPEGINDTWSQQQQRCTYSKGNPAAAKLQQHAALVCQARLHVLTVSKHAQHSCSSQKVATTLGVSNVAVCIPEVTVVAKLQYHAALVCQARLCDDSMLVTEAVEWLS